MPSVRESLDALRVELSASGGVVKAAEVVLAANRKMAGMAWGGA